jgi:hypothetical protein
MGSFKRSLLAVASAVFAMTVGEAAATPVTWQLDNAVLGSGRTATGSFVFDADAVVYSNINITTAPSPTNQYGIPRPSLPGNTFVLTAVTGQLADYTNMPTLGILWSTPLTNAGGTVPFFTLVGSFEGTCLNASCTTISSDNFRAFVSGQAVAVAVVAEPASLTLLAVGLFGVGIARRRLGKLSTRGRCDGTKSR